LALITKTKLPTNATNDTNYKELALQWEDRNHRLNDFVEVIQPENEEFQNGNFEIMNVEENIQVEQVPEFNEEQLQSI
jgi:hypothetical protein